MSQEDRQHQIASLFSHNTAVTVIIDGQQYEIGMDGDIQILVNLPPTFPDEAPVMTVSPTGMRHPWIDSDVIVCDALLSWHPQYSVGMVVHDIFENFKTLPPTLRSATEDTYGHRPQPPIPTNAPPSAQPPAEYLMIMNKSPEEINELLSNDRAFEIFFHSLDRVQNMKTVKEELCNGNENLARKNLSYEEELIRLRSQVTSMNKEYQELRSKVSEKERQQQDAFNRFSSSTIMTRLKAGVNESDDLSESVAQSFLDGSLDHESFVKQFRDLRKVYHLRASNLEKLQRNDTLFS
ncbi:hypothetical protein DM01DRAFT_1334561 [Hesseltinella vesiculosa]|uniref:VPS37 C-terminal domain-containing protein n=1 Tax=Hesseltinella vesiculosa TaxID=101127 RepID=A0A1X2GM80_9FUNG|nr:hypothetical protein DM01DRAFT_1334561 [Hesseltinella vesiculosa]